MQINIMQICIKYNSIIIENHVVYKISYRIYKSTGALQYELT